LKYELESANISEEVDKYIGNLSREGKFEMTSLELLKVKFIEEM
jgi:hypothetical protein